MVLGIFLSVLEWRRKNRNRVLRITAISVALISAYVIYLRPTTPVAKPFKSVVLVGENVSKSLSDYIAKFSDYEVLFWDKKTHLLQNKNRSNSKSFNQLDYSIDTLFVRGYVPPINPDYYQHLQYSDTLQQNYSIDYTEKVYLGDTVPLIINNKSTESLLLIGMIGNDTIENQSLKGGKAFTYNYIPKTIGFHTSTILINEKEEYHFSFAVENKRKYVFHLLAETPDFEWRFLKDFLGEEGHAVYLRSKISKNKYKKDFVNWPDSLNQQQRSYNPIYHNILIADMEAWNAMGNSVKNQYRAQLKKEQGIALYRANENARLDLPNEGVVIAGDDLQDFEAVNELNVNTTDDLTFNRDLRLYYAYLADRSIGITTLQDTYKWQLAGNEQKYRQYWTSVINQLLRDQDEIYIEKTRWPVQFQPFHLQLWSGTIYNELLLVDQNQESSKIELMKDKNYPERQHLVYYPTQIGWHQILTKNNDILDQFYVHPEQAESQNLMDLSYKFRYNNYKDQISAEKEIFSANNKDKPLILWFFLLFLLSISYLWIEEKI